MTLIDDVTSWEVLDSRGNPTVRVAVTCDSRRSVFSVPSGASTGAHEAVERRDRGCRYGGKGVMDVVTAINEELAPIVIGQDVFEQKRIDELLIQHDGTRNLSRFGANAILGVSGATLHAASRVAQQPLYEYLEDKYGPGIGRGHLPLPMVNILSGGLHAYGGIEIQDFLVIPNGADSYSDGLETVWAVRTTVRERIVEDGNRPLVADEGGFAPPFSEIEDAFELLTSCIDDTEYVPGDDVSLAVDVAATHFYDSENEVYKLSSVGKELDREAMVDLVLEWIERYPLLSVEDPLAEDDWEGWKRLASHIKDDIQLLGDDLIVTNTNRLTRAANEEAANAVLVKPNQAGTVTRAVDVIKCARANGFHPVVSARSGETCDVTIADLAVGLNAGQIKIGSLARSERLAKYNRLLEIDRFKERKLATVSFPPGDI